MMEMAETTAGKAVIITVSGEMTLFNVQPFRQRVTALINDGATRIVVDLSGVDELDSSGIGVLISCKTILKKSKGDLKIASPSNVVRKLVQLTRLEQILDFFDTPEEALASFEPSKEV